MSFLMTSLVKHWVIASPSTKRFEITSRSCRSSSSIWLFMTIRAFISISRASPVELVLPFLVELQTTQPELQPLLYSWWKSRRKSCLLSSEPFAREAFHMWMTWSKSSFWPLSSLWPTEEWISLIKHAEIDLKHRNNYLEVETTSHVFLLVAFVVVRLRVYRLNGTW